MKFSDNCKPYVTIIVHSESYQLSAVTLQCYILIQTMDK